MWREGEETERGCDRGEGEGGRDRRTGMEERMGGGEMEVWLGDGAGTEAGEGGVGRGATS